jgi:hypothetical protein
MGRSGRKWGKQRSHSWSDYTVPVRPEPGEPGCRGVHRHRVVALQRRPGWQRLRDADPMAVLVCHDELCRLPGLP